MTKVKVRRHESYSIEHEDRTFEITFEACEYHDPVIKILPDGRAIVGYLVRDDDCDNPLDDCDCSGRIIDRRQRRQETENEALEALGINRYGEAEGEPNPYAVLLDVYSHGGDCWRIHGGGQWFPDENWDVSNGAGLWLPDKCCLDEIDSRALRMCLPEGTKVEYVSRTNPDGTVKMLKDGKTADPKHFNVITYTLPDGKTRGGYKSFSSAYRAAAKALGITICKKDLAAGARKAAVEMASQAVETYNQWLAGDVWGVCVDFFDAEGNLTDDNDSCWGHIGSTWAEQALAEEVEGHYRHMLKSAQ